MANLQYTDMIKTEITISFTNEERRFKRHISDWMLEHGWVIQEIHKGLYTSRITFSQEFSSLQAKDDKVQAVVDKLNARQESE